MLEKPVDAVAISGNIEFAERDISLVSSWAVQFVWTGTVAANVVVLASLDGINFAPITSATQPMGGAAGSHLFNGANLASFTKIKPAVSGYASGTGTLSVYLSGKDSRP